MLGWLLYRRHKDQEMPPRKNQMTLLDFHVEIADRLSKQGKTTKTTPSRGRPSLTNLTRQRVKRRPPTIADPALDIRIDQVGHFPKFDEKQSRCRHCKSGYTATSCQKCGVNLCMVRKRQCFNVYHGVSVNEES